MKPALVAIFAHPDDEAFGPAGTLYKYRKTHDVYLICATRGEAGDNYIDGDTKNIAKIREQEMKKAAKILGVKDVYFLNYKDGSLSNDKYHSIATDIQAITDKLKPEIFMTYENRGITGHIDHVAISLITNYVFRKASYAKKLLLYCITCDMSDEFKDYFIFVPEGYKMPEIDKVVDVSAVWDTKVEALMQHRSQLKDVKEYLKEVNMFRKIECFLVHKKVENLPQ